MKGNTRGSVLFRFLDEVKVKGKNDSVKIFEPMLENNENINIKEIYERGFKFYQDGLWDKAMEIFKENKKDQPSEFLIERIQGLQKNPPQEWDGIWKWEEK